MNALSPDFRGKLYNVITSCTSPEQLTVAGRYLKLAERAGYTHGLNFIGMGIENVRSTGFRDSTQRGASAGVRATALARL